MDISADMAYNRELNALQDMKDPPYLSLIKRMNQAVTIIQMSWHFPLTSPLKYIYLAAMITGHSHIRAHSRMQRRTCRT